MKDFLGKTIFITGAAKGIGKHLSELFYHRNASIVMADIYTEGMVEYTAKWNKDRYLIIQMDVSDSKRWENAMTMAIKKYGCIHYGINAAGIIEPGYIEAVGFDSIDRTIDVNLKGTMYGSKIFAQQFLIQKHGHIINFGSLASLAAVPGLNTYSASKFGVRGFTLAIAQELEDKGIFVSLICPDAVNTPMLEYQKDKEAAALTFSGSRPLTVVEVGKSILYIIEKKERELWLPTFRGITAVTSTFAPSLAKMLRKILMAKGVKNQKLW